MESEFCLDCFDDHPPDAECPSWAENHASPRPDLTRRRSIASPASTPTGSRCTTPLDLPILSRTTSDVQLTPPSPDGTGDVDGPAAKVSRWSQGQRTRLSGDFGSLEVDDPGEGSSRAHNSSYDPTKDLSRSLKVINSRSLNAEIEEEDGIQAEEIDQWEREYDLGGGEHFEDTGGLDVGPEGPTQQIAPEDLEPEENMEGILLGFGYFPAEVTLPNNLAVRAGLVEVETTPGAFNCMQMICNILRNL